MNIKGKKTSMSSGITLIALVITIIVLLILAGIAIASLSGENGLLNRSSQAKEEAVKAQLKEEIEMAIMDIQAEEVPKGNNVTLKSLAGQGDENGQLENHKDLQEGNITADLGENEITGEYKDYDFTIDKNFNVIIEGKITSEKPLITYTLSPETIGATEVTITVTATINEGTITKIIKPDGEEVLNTANTNTQIITYKVTKSGKYTFRAKSSTGRSATCIVKVSNIKPLAPEIIIVREGGYPILTSEGITEDKGSIVKIGLDDSDKDNELIKIYYNEGDEENWKEYVGEFTTSSTTIKAKSVIEINSQVKIESNIASKNINIKTDGLNKEAFDDNYETGIVLGVNDVQTNSYIKNKYIYVDRSCWGKYITIRSNMTDKNYGCIYFYEDNVRINDRGWIRELAEHKLSDEYLTSVQIPSNCTKINLSTGGGNAVWTLYEVWCSERNLDGCNIDER